MKTLILTCNTGQGHNSSALAIKEEFRTMGCQCDIADTLRFLSKSTSKITDVCFTNIYCHIPKAFDFGYSHTSIAASRFFGSDYLTNALYIGAKRLKCKELLNAPYRLEMKSEILKKNFNIKSAEKIYNILIQN